MDMRYYCLKCREAQEQFCIFWRPGGQNLADYWTKHHPSSHHQNMRGKFLTKLENLKGLCTNAKEQAHHVSTSKYPSNEIITCFKNHSSLNSA
jgi:hypothetical protein